MKTRSTRPSPSPVPFLLLALSATLSCGVPPPFKSSRPPGPTDKGGIRLLVAVKAEGESLERSVGQTLEIIKSRCDHLGVFCDVRREGGAGSNRIALRVSGPRDAERVKRVLLAQGLLELRPVVSPPSPMPPLTYATRAEAVEAAGAGNDVLPYAAEDAEPGEFIVVERTRVITGQDLRDAGVVALSDTDEGPFTISFSLKPEGAARLGSWTEANIGRYVAVALNGEARSVPYIRSKITEDGQIAGNFTREQAEDVALTLRSGGLPAPVEVLEEGTYKP
jgi:protein-export membrane protein SecD